MQSSVLYSVRVNMMERRPLVAIGRKATDRIRDKNRLLVYFLKPSDPCERHSLVFILKILL